MTNTLPFPTHPQLQLCQGCSIPTNRLWRQLVPLAPQTHTPHQKNLPAQKNWMRDGVASFGLIPIPVIAAVAGKS